MKRLNGVAHDLGDHAVSGLACLTHNLYRVCAEAGNLEIVVHVHPPAYPAGLRRDARLETALSSLNEFFTGLLAKHRFELQHVDSAFLAFVFSSDWPESPETRRYREVCPGPYERDPAYRCKAVLVAANGRKYSHNFSSWHHASA